MADGQSLLDDTTIVAIATPPGRGGIGIVRLSGTAALAIARLLLPKLSEIVPRHATYALLHDADGARIDDAVVTWFQAPHSYTGEDVVEIATHGAPVVLHWLVRSAVQHGAMPARAGEFTERAFLRNRLDLTAAEAVRDLIDAQTLGQAKLAAQQMGGSIAAAIAPAKAALLALIAAMEAGIDFAEDDIDTLTANDIAVRITAMQPPLQNLLRSFVHGRLLREGLQLAIVGKPNAGKSSLFNRLVERDRAIVTATPGTTRDVIAERIHIEGVPVELLDTAGLRETEDEAERLGVSRSRRALAEADAVLLVIDAAASPSPRAGDTPLHTESRLTQEDDAALEAMLQGRPVLRVTNKIDLIPQPDRPPAAGETVHVSAVTGEGIAQLRSAILQTAKGNVEANPGDATLTNLRQHNAVDRAVTALRRAATATATNTPHEMVLLDLYEALRSLDELTGQTTGDDVLTLIFSTFCIGK